MEHVLPSNKNPQKFNLNLINQFVHSNDSSFILRHRFSSLTSIRGKSTIVVTRAGILVRLFIGHSIELTVGIDTFSAICFVNSYNL